MTPAPAAPALDVLVIGGGQAGLAMGYHLAQRGLHFKIVDAGGKVGAAWRSRWDSLRAFTPAQYDNLPGLAFPAAPDTYPGKDDVADYLQAYAAHFELPVRLNTMVTSLTRSNGVYVARAKAGAWEARQVVVATGPFQVPFIPPIAGELDPGVRQLHSVEYRNPATMPPGRVLVVGAANSGCQIAEELAATHRVELAVGQRMPAVPQRPLGRDVWWWASMLGLDRVTAGSRLGRRLAGRDQVIGGGPRQLARRHGVRIRPRATGAAGRTVTVRRWRRCRIRRGGMGDRLHDRPLVDRRPRCGRRAGRHRAPAWRHALARVVSAGPHLAAHPNLGAAGLGAKRRGLPRRADRGPRA